MDGAVEERTGQNVMAPSMLAVFDIKVEMEKARG